MINTIGHIVNTHKLDKPNISKGESERILCVFIWKWKRKDSLCFYLKMKAKGFYVF